MKNKIGRIILKGSVVDANTRCVHYHSLLDIIAIKFKCCDQYYPCYYCHLETADHPPAIWEKTEFDVKAVLCGICFTEMTIGAYNTCNYQCPICKSAFNPQCANHDHLYFEQ